MPFELTHIVMGQQVLQNINKPLNPSLLAGIIYPDIRYPAKMTRGLTHTLEGLGISDQDDFSLGVKLHLETDLIWDEVMLVDKPRDAALIGGLKLVHEKLSDRLIGDKDKLKKYLNASILPNNTPVTVNQWKEWVGALGDYIFEGANTRGWTHIIVKMGFMNETDVRSRLEVVEKMVPKYEREIKERHEEVVKKLISVFR